jgi:hypothetical protein
MLRTADRILAFGVILLGIMQALSTFYFFAGVEEPALWFFAGGMLLVLVGVLALLRQDYGALAPGLRLASVTASVVLALFWIALYTLLFEKFAPNPPSFLGPAIIVASALVSVLQLGRGRSRPSPAHSGHRQGDRGGGGDPGVIGDRGLPVGPESP